jgi:N-methylhydantoinase B/oxoprolinase/acetone carboxylase alpha subunit
MSHENIELGKVDPVTFEVLRHRLWAINDEQGAIAARISGSPAIYETFDFNIGILTATGKGVFTGVYIGHHAIPLEIVVKSVKERFGEDIQPGDMFFTNDPWCGALHANDGVLAAPVFWENKIICWTAIVMHDMDVGGPVAGSWVVGAKETFEEAPLYPPIKLVRQDSLQQDIYSVLRRNCRIPDKNYLNMKARVSSQIMTRRRLFEIIHEYGRDIFVNLLEQVINHTNFVLKSRLREIPDGSWWEYGYLDHNGITNQVYKLVVKLTKKGTKLTFDFTGTDRQAIGSINCTSSGMRGGVLGPLLAMLCYDLPWSTGALEDIVEIISEEGTVNNATFPAGCSMASLQGAHATQHVAHNAIARMLCCSRTFKEEAQACWQPYLTGIFTSGLDPRGQSYVDGFPDGGAGGGGARTFADGIEGGGMIHSLRAAIPNVETNEYVQPILQIYRRYCPDTCGHGMYRGGVGLEFAYTPLGIPQPLTCVYVSAGVSAPSGRGLFGGYPSSINANVVLRNSDILELFKKGIIPTNMDEIKSAATEILQAKANIQMVSGDVAVTMEAGGGGYGDPLKRDPEMVCRDAANGLVSREVARRVHGVVFRNALMRVDKTKTARLREEILGKRRGRKALREKEIIDRLKAQGIEYKDLKTTQIVSDFLDVRVPDAGTGSPVIFCSSCGTPLCFTSENLREYMSRSQPIPIDFLSPVNQFCADPVFSMIEYSCPDCGTLLSVDIVRQEELETVRPEFLLTEE